MRFFKVVLASALGYILAALIFLALFIVLGIGIASNAKPDHAISSQSVLHLKLNFPLSDRSNPEDPFTAFMHFNPNIEGPIGLNDILQSIESAKTDSKIKGIVLDLTTLHGGYAKISEIRNKIAEFKESGKFVYAYADYYYFPTYYLASVSDSVFINPEGEMMFNGMVAEIAFFGNTLKKMGVEMQVIRQGKYKGAVESFTREGLSPENREQIDVYIHSVYDNVLDKISRNRSLTAEEMKVDANDLQLISSEDFVNKGYIDIRAYRDEFYTAMKRRMGLDPEKKVELVSLQKYKHHTHTKGGGSDRIAIIYACGDIVGGKGDGSQIAAEDMAMILKKVREDKSVKAVVFRIDSRGGSSLASEIIWREVKLLADEKPLVVSMSDVAASGGYYIACPATRIVAEPTSITGSIGVFGLLPNAEELLNDKLGINMDYVGTGKYSDIGRIDRPLKAEELVYLEHIVNNIYQQFLKRVSEGRGMSIAEVDSIAQGRIWTGDMAKKIGLVDELGGLETAIALARSEAGLEEYRIKEYPKQEDPLQMIMRKISGTGSLQSQIEASPAAKYFKLLQSAAELGTQQSVQMRMLYELNPGHTRPFH